MFARCLSALLKPDTLGEFTQIFEPMTLPVMRQQQDVLMFGGEQQAVSPHSAVTRANEG
jgi:hypothetical protein